MNAKFFLVFITVINTTGDLLIASIRLFGRDYKQRQRKNKKTTLENTLQTIRTKILELQEDLDLLRKNYRPEDEWDQHLMTNIIDKLTDLQEKEEKISLSIKKTVGNV